MNRITTDRIMGVGDYAICKLIDSQEIFVWYREDEYANVFMAQNSPWMQANIPTASVHWLNDLFTRRFTTTGRYVTTTGLRNRAVRRFKEIFGRDIEVLNIELDYIFPQAPEPEVATQFFCDKYTRDVTFEGQHGYHHHHGETMNSPRKRYSGHRIGVELEVCFNSDEERDCFNSKPSNWFFRENDGSLTGYGCEIITIPLLPEDAKSEEFWDVLTNELSRHAKSWETDCCGLHVHIGREILGKDEEERSENLGKLLYLYHHYVKDSWFNGNIYGRTTGYHEQNGRTDAGDAVTLLGKDVLSLKSVKDNVKNAMLYRSRRDRYFDINITNLATIEFRKGRGSINKRRIACVVEYNEKLCLYAKATPWTQISREDFIAYLNATASPALKGFIE